MKSGFYSLHFLTNPPSEACLYDHIKWTLGQIQRQALSDLSQYLDFMHDGKAKTGFHFKVKNRSASETGSTPLVKKIHFDTHLVIDQMVQKILRRKEAIEVSFLVSCRLDVINIILISCAD